jgi:hypothetical protein
MGIPDGAHTHGSGGSGLGTALLVLAGAALAVKAAPAILGAAAELLHVVLIVVFIVACTGAVGVVALLALKCRRARAGAAARTMPPLPPQVVRAAPPLPQERRVGELPRESQRELPGGLHLHFHGISAEDVAAILQDSPDVNLDGQQRVTRAWPRQDG